MDSRTPAAASLAARALLVAALAFACGGGELEPTDPDLGEEQHEPRVPFFVAKESAYLQADPVVGHAHRPHVRHEIRWPEHPAGGFVMATNGLGLRDDRETSERAPEGVLRAIAVGDSHLDGVMANAETFPKVLERLLAEREGRPRWEVLNGGVGYYGPVQYRRSWDKHRHLRPDLFVVALYAGNDFLDASRGVEFHRKAAGEAPLERPPGYHERVQRAFKLCGPAVSQALNQAAYFAAHPGMREPTLAFVEEQLADLARSTSEAGARLFVLLWPSLVDAQRELDGEHVQRAIEALALDEAALAHTRGMVLELAAWMSSRGIEHLDLHERIAEASEPCYWRADHHLNVHAHALTARALLELRAELFARGADVR